MVKDKYIPFDERVVLAVENVGFDQQFCFVWAMCMMSGRTTKKQGHKKAPGIGGLHEKTEFICIAVRYC